jgi:hypothetical protein
VSRFSDDYGGEQFPNQGELWAANAQRALKGRKGRKALAELREALLALPEKKLIAGALSTVGATAEAEAMPEQVPVFGGGLRRNWRREDLLDVVKNEGEGVCAIGAYVWHQKVKAGADPQEAFAQLPRLLGADGDGDLQTADLAQKELGLTFTLAWTLASMNDETFGSATPERRYERFLEWIENELGEAVPA